MIQSSDVLHLLLVGSLVWTLTSWLKDSADADVAAVQDISGAESAVPLSCGGGNDTCVSDNEDSRTLVSPHRTVPTYSTEQLSLFDGRPGKDFVWTVEVDASSGGSPGLHLVIDQSKTLVVEALDATGLIAQWNLRNPLRAVQDGDAVLALNDLKEPMLARAAQVGAVQAELARHAVLRIRLTRKTDATILLAILGRVFNVTSGHEFYSTGQTYRRFAGHDCSHALAIVSTKAKFLDRNLDGVEQKQLEHLNSTFWTTYIPKYPIVGVLEDPPYNLSLYDHFAGPIGDVAAELVVMRWREKYLLVYYWDARRQEVMLWRKRSWIATSFTKDWVEAFPEATAAQLWDVVPPGQEPPRRSLLGKLTYVFHAIGAAMDAAPCR